MAGPVKVRAGFLARNSFWGRLRLRWDEPSPHVSEAALAAQGLYERVLERLLTENTEFGTVVDVGAGDWYYAERLVSFFPSAHVLGIEVDGFRRYLNLHRRVDLGKARARALSRLGRRVEYRHQDFLALRPGEIPGSGRILFTFFFPFVSRDPCLAWGLPEEFSDFPGLLRHARALAGKLGREAFVLSVHQGEWEGEIAELAYRGSHARRLRFEPEELRGWWPAPYAIECFLAETRP